MRKKTVLIYIFYFLLSIFIFRDLITRGVYIFNADLTKSFSLDRFFQAIFFAWNSQGNYPSLHEKSQLPFYLPFFIISKLLSLNTTQFFLLVFITAQFLAAYSCFKLSSYLLRLLRAKNYLWPAFLAGLFYSFNPFVISEVRHPFIRVAYSLVPFIALFFIKSLEERKMRYIILTAFFYVLAIGNLHFLFFGALLIVSMAIYDILYRYVSEKIINLDPLKSAFLVFLFFFLSSLYFFLPYLTSKGVGISSEIDSLTGLYVNANFRGIFSFRVSHQIYSFYRPESFSNFSLIASLVLALLSFSAFLFKKQKWPLFFGFLFVLVGGFVVAPWVDMVQKLFYFFLVKFPFQQYYARAFRTPKLAMLLPLALAIPFSLTVSELINLGRKKILPVVYFLIIFLVALAAYPLINGDVGGELSPVSLPKPINEVMEFINRDPTDFKVIWIPTYVVNKPFWNPDHDTSVFAETSTPKQTFYRGDQPVDNYLSNTLQLEESRYPRMIHLEFEYPYIDRYLGLLGVKYIVLHNDLKKYRQEFEAFKTGLETKSALKKVFEKDFIVVFEVAGI